MELDALWRPIDIIGCNLIGKRFIGAQSVEGVLQMGEKLKKQGYGVTYNLLGEHVKDKETVEMAIKTTRTLIEKMNADNYGNVSCKPTLYGLCLSRGVFLDTMKEIVGCAYGQGIEVEIDAENYGHIQDTFAIFLYFASDQYLRNTVRQAVQAHLKKIEGLMDKYGLWDKNLRIVKGSGVYQDSESIATQSDFLVTERYLEILRRNLKNGRVPFVATVRDSELAEAAIELTEEGDYLFEFQMLYGPAGRKLGSRLLRRGYPVRIYVPFTDSWCKDVWKPYGLRRAKMIRRILWRGLRA